MIKIEDIKILSDIWVSLNPQNIKEVFFLNNRYLRKLIDKYKAGFSIRVGRRPETPGVQHKYFETFKATPGCLLQVLFKHKQVIYNNNYKHI